MRGISWLVEDLLAFRKDSVPWSVLFGCWVSWYWLAIQDTKEDIWRQLKHANNAVSWWRMTTTTSCFRVTDCKTVKCFSQAQKVRKVPLHNRMWTSPNLSSFLAGCLPPFIHWQRHERVTSSPYPFSHSYKTVSEFQCRQCIDETCVPLQKAVRYAILVLIFRISLDFLRRLQWDFCNDESSACSSKMWPESEMCVRI